MSLLNETARVTTQQGAGTQVHEKAGARRRRQITSAIVYTVLILIGITMVFPLLWMASTSLKSEPELYVLPPLLLPAHPQWSNYAEAFRYIPYFRMLANSIIVAVVVTLARVITSSFAGFAFARLSFPGRDKLFLLYLAILMVPFPVTMIPLYVIMSALGWLNTLYALIFPSFVSVFNTFLMRQYMLTLPRELEESARIDGAGYPTIYARIIMPLCGPAVAAVTVFSFMNAWNSFIWPLLVISKPDRSTLPIGLLLVGVGRGAVGEGANVPWNQMMAVALASALPLILVFLLAQRYFVEGIAMTGIKG